MQFSRIMTSSQREIFHRKNGSFDMNFIISSSQTEVKQLKFACVRILYNAF